MFHICSFVFMEPPLSRLLLLTFCLFFRRYVDSVESQSYDRNPLSLSPSPSPSPSSSPSPSPSPSPPFPPPPFRAPPPPPKYQKNETNHHRQQAPPPQPHSRNHIHKLNTGEKVGLLFIGIAAILQIGVVGFLVFKRRQLFKVNGAQETCYSAP